ncbi:ABC transporter substrate-binding protein [Bengtsoniella intestinalis]|uniref:ABC transporter substrate-binding protein n=1 Tax=Bengtsoniella intestinalis TaxID=3073143 RepID=UPI00391F7F7A
MKRIATTLLALVMTMSLLSACADATVSETIDTAQTAVDTAQTLVDTAETIADDLTTTEPVTIQLNEVTHSVFYAPLYAAMELGYFEEEGLTIELTNGGGADNVMTAVITGGADIGLAGPESCIYVVNEGLDDAPQIFAQLTKRDGAFIVGREDEEFSWENLIGSTIIGGRAGGVPLMTLQYVMTQNGVIPNVDAVVDSSVEFAMMAGAFTGGYGDYVALFEPTATTVELEGQGYVLTSIGQESGEIPYTAFFALTSYMDENPDIIQAFTNAMARGQAWVQTADVADIAAAVSKQFPDTDLDVLETVIQRHLDIDAWNQTPVMEESALRRLEDVMILAGELDQSCNFDALVNNSFANNATW